SATGTAVQWYTVATGGTPLLSTDALVTGTYYASQTVGSCESATRLTVTITLNPSVPVSVSIIEDLNNVCAGTTVTFTATPVNGGITPAYQWYNGATSVGTDSPTYAYVPADGDVITVVLTSSETCQSGGPATSNTVTMVVDPALPVSVTIAEDANDVCEGITVSFTATPVNEGVTPSYQWSVNGLNAGGNLPAFSYVPVNGDVVNLILTSSETCQSGGPATSNNITMNVNPVLAASVSIAADANPACTGSNVTFTATPVYGGITPSYQWYNGVTAVGTDNAVYSYTPSDGDLITVVLTSSETCQSGGPATSNAITMSVSPGLPVSVTIAEDLNNVCEGTTVTYTATPVNGGTIPSYQWYNGATAVGTDNPVFSYLPADGDIITVVLSSGEICQSGSPATSNAITMTVNPPLPVSVTVAEDANNVCEGTTVTFTATPVNGGTTPSYQWYNGATAVGSGSPAYSYVPANGDVITVVLTSNEICQSSGPSTSNAVTLVVNPILPVSVSIAADINPICAGASVTLTATLVNGGLTPSYQWYNGLTPVGTDNAVYSYVPDDGDIITVVLTSSEACQSGGPATSNAVVIAVSSPINVTSIPGNILCTGSATGAIDVTVAGGSAPYNYVWTGNGVVQGIEDQTGLTAGSYSVVVTDANNCQATPHDITLTEPATVLSGNISTQTNVSCPGSVDGSVTVDGAGGVAPYEFSINAVGYQVSGTFSGLGSGSHIITVRDANLCTADIAVSITEPTAIAISSIVVDASCPDTPDGSISLDLSGGTPPYNVIWSDGVTSVNRTNVTDGTYSVIVTDANGCAASVDSEVGVVGSETCLVVQEIITPNNDGFNDTWKIRNIELFPDAEVLVYNRWGRLVFKTKNISANEWDGTSNGKQMPNDSYHYILHLNNGSKPRSGVVSILR
ncbi:MAG TPA: gliding motility-associated C-terminal domain-containing protein, partial [Bacteroidales bacterium]|nr:gliding motility-associated C-terminal domain-containing protein [Bacteroidales bacterium]